jgi:probable lipoprotein NlpC
VNRLLTICFALVLCSATLSSCKSHKRGTRCPTPKETTTSKNSKIQEKYATVLDVKPSEITNIRLYEFVDQWQGTPYRYGGTTKTGVDCSGFVGSLYLDVYQKSIPRSTNEIEKVTKHINKSSLKEGDVVFFDIDGKKTSHVGVYLQNGRFVHASSSKGVIISNLSNPYYQKSFNRGGKF